MTSEKRKLKDPVTMGTYKAITVPRFPAALPRSTSTPGLVESIGKIPLEEMWVSPLPLYPAGKTSPDSA